MSGSKSGKSPGQQLDMTKGGGNAAPSSEEGAGATQADMPILEGTAPPTSVTPLTAEEMQAVMSEQPTGVAPSAEEIEDRRDAQSSAQNLLPREKLENGIKQARSFFATGWAGFTASVRDIEQSETVGKIKEGTVSIIDRSMDGLSKVGSKVAEVTDKSVVAVGAKLEEAAPTLGRWRDGVVNASERGFTAAKEMTDRAIEQVKKPSAGGGGGGSGDVAGESVSGSASGGGGGGSEGKGGGGETSGEQGPHTV